MNIYKELIKYPIACSMFTKAFKIESMSFPFDSLKSLCEMRLQDNIGYFLLFITKCQIKYCIEETTCSLIHVPTGHVKSSHDNNITECYMYLIINAFKLIEQLNE